MGHLSNMRALTLGALTFALALPGACSKERDSLDEGDEGREEATSTATAGATTTASGSAGSGASTSAESGEGEEAGEAGTAANPIPIDCGGVIYACADGMDNDGDGKVDAADPECVSPCDDDEGSFATGIPGDNMDCKQDCFFDGNSGSGDDKCDYNLRCDPADPGAGTNCAYREGAGGCERQVGPDCLEACQGLVPNGCDCFGCCEVQNGDETVHVFLGSADPECSLAQLDKCARCTPTTDCNNECIPGDCEVCFGGELPPGCEEAGCPDGFSACDAETAACPEGTYCVTGCCYPLQG